MDSGLFANTVAGLTAGGTSTIAMHPLDLVKTRMQVTGGTTMSQIRSVYRGNGIAGLYRGLGTNLIGGMLGWGFYFAWYGRVKKWIGGERIQLSGTEYLVSSATAGMLTSICTNPIWVVKTRMLTTNRGDKLAYNNFFGNLSPQDSQGSTLIAQTASVRLQSRKAFEDYIEASCQVYSE